VSALRLPAGGDDRLGCHARWPASRSSRPVSAISKALAAWPKSRPGPPEAPTVFAGRVRSQTSLCQRASASIHPETPGPAHFRCAPGRRQTAWRPGGLAGRRPRDYRDV